MRSLLPLALALFVAACASSGGYSPASSSGGYGYADQIIETGRYRVTYRARSADAAEDGALRRAAELATQNGFDHFTVVARDIDRQRAGGGSSIGIGGSTGGRRSGIGLGVSVPLSSGREDVSVRLEVVMGQGEKPEGPRSYDARQLLSNLASQ